MRKATHKEAAKYLGLSVRAIGKKKITKSRDAMLIGVATILDELKEKKALFAKHRLITLKELYAEIKSESFDTAFEKLEQGQTLKDLEEQIKALEG